MLLLAKLVRKGGGSGVVTGGGRENRMSLVLEKIVTQFLFESKLYSL